MSQYNDDDNFNQNDATDITSNHASLAALDINATDSIDDALLDMFYHRDHLLPIMMATLDYIDECIKDSLTLPYFADIEPELWQDKSKALDIYITDDTEGRALNLEARGKDYATNILSYPSDLPAAVIELMPTLPLGELIICHDVIVREAAEQEKTVAQHISHLLVHGVLHLLGFDHELGQAEQDEMEQLEIDILAGLNLPNPYI
ncbi:MULTISPECIES: rRNA maturation RNase YbeY [unclassified Psychrobacter]|uniref:rRNA maturation RNase YbeY n=1 Tax=unclassified Psychrobacter TaxID=196806 RepID=UPI0025B3D313|nr:MULTISPECIES: rRNA maturation RNase YbeY [unclassified Psychrobacter]MDN3452046.1 rRNA maturation RNase YbeY [Psychrobacter sp. APC 3350]MDN3501346.1 rRNA maturation RNase YbeY [Psychrobacter sp. 5A.1]